MGLLPSKNNSSPPPTQQRNHAFNLISTQKKQKTKNKNKNKKTLKRKEKGNLTERLRDKETERPSFFVIDLFAVNLYPHWFILLKQIKIKIKINRETER